MYFSKSLVALAIVASGFAAVAGKTNAKNRKCTFYCRGQGVCAVVLERDPVGAPSVTTVQRANPTDNFEDFYNCVDTHTTTNFCCSPDGFPLPIIGTTRTIRGDLVDRKCREPTDQDPHLPAGCR
ncbi:hypothetical protein PSTG_10270 [Puccinia striiformis f. sp. tritici PST-78]|uniref:Hydrophobin n=1 Tax=Puccinia striiformis f. sp. tritici PST-78 TaxID=1165861 RepID=A0A0L0VBU1_9BASI|nr:hypothetical protein PSTG_10270 [Puccinia striiformis f. sp. tritici PST-78]